jgi:hypothetical protein
MWGKISFWFQTGTLTASSSATAASFSTEYCTLYRKIANIRHSLQSMEVNILSKMSENWQGLIIYLRILIIIIIIITLVKLLYIYVKSKDVPQQAAVAVGVPGRLRPQIISTFGTTRVVGRQPYAPTAFTPGEIPGIHFQKLSWSQGTWFCRKKRRNYYATVLLRTVTFTEYWLKCLYIPHYTNIYKI